MSEEENKSVEQEAQAVAPAAESEVVVQEAVKEDVQEKKQQKDAAYNWAETRRKMQELDRQNRDMQEKLNAIERQKAAPEIDEIDKLGDDDLMTKAQAKRLAERVAKQAANEAIRQREAATVEDRLTLKHTDFADVVTKENIELLKQTEPELALSLSHNPDPYAQGIAAYKLIKKLGIGGEVEMTPEKEKAKANSQKPVSVNAVARQSAIGNAHLFENGLTKELKASLWKEMEQCRKRAS